MKLEDVARSTSSGAEVCPAPFVKVIPFEESTEGNGVLEIIFWVVFAFLVVLAVGLIIRYLRKHKLYKKVKAEKADKDKKVPKDGGKKAEPPKEPAVGGEGEAAGKPPSVQGKVGEDPKKK